MQGFNCTDSSSEWLIYEPDRNCYCVIYRNAIPYEYSCELYNKCVSECTEQILRPHRFNTEAKVVQSINGPINVPKGFLLQPRTNIAYANDDITGHTYSGQTLQTNPWPMCMKILRDFVSQFKPKFNSCLVNGYLINDHYVDYHRDAELNDEDNTVATVSLGVSRKFRFREYGNKSTIPKYETILNNRDIVYFYGNTNLYYEHMICKAKKNDIVSPRYSVTFRIIKSV